MKKFIFCLVVLMMMVTGVVAMPVEPTVPREVVEMIDWAYLGTSAGAIAMTLLIVQLLKAPLDKIFHIPTRAFVYMVALLLMLAAAAFTGGIAGVGDILLIAINAVGVALSAMGAYDVTFAKMDM